MALRRWAQTFAGGQFASGMARLNARHPWSHNDHFHAWILANIPARRGVALDVGCGRGELLAALSPYFVTVQGNDIDAGMREKATARCTGLSNVTVRGGDWTDAPGPVDAVTMIAVLHHLDAAAALQHVRRILAPGGRFLAVGLARPVSAVDHLWDLASTVTNPMIGYVKHPWPAAGKPQPAPFPVRDPTMSFDELKKTVVEVMPGAVMRHHLAFRHTILWTKPA
ncbi:class I SAM-dependent methyltransferase [Humibacter sp.]|uniref:class I SAM-dependent methyltransferase n=1 Tax=Humibacter sp. TaxID=1940291 RepID=UPI003F803C6E